VVVLHCRLGKVAILSELGTGRALRSWRRAVEEGWCRFINCLSQFTQGKGVPDSDKLVV
jgi:hypothetical protein